MTTHVEYWPVGQTVPVEHPLTADDISAHLAEDWLPSLALPVGSALLSWPAYLTQTIAISGMRQRLALRPELGRTDRQWKIMLSWMIGAAAAREVLRSEGYDWIAPLSAFYKHSGNAVDIASPHATFRQGTTTAEKDPKADVNLMPDYIASRRAPSGGHDELVLVEAKGTRDNLKSMISAKPAWRKQSKNAIVMVNGQPYPVSRNIVVAARVSPSGQTGRSRCIQIRAWNQARSDEGREQCFRSLTVDIAAAQLFGVCVNLGLERCAEAISLATADRRDRAGKSLLESYRRSTAQASEEADLEVQETLGAVREPGDRWAAGRRILDSGQHRMEVRLEPATVSAIRILGSPSSINRVSDQLIYAEAELNGWRDRTKGDLQSNVDGRAYSSSGLTLQFDRRP